MMKHAGKFWPSIATRTLPTAAFVALFLAAVTLLHARPRQQVLPEIVGRVDGADFSIEAPAGVQTAPGDLSALMSGGRVIVHSGQARIALNGGGDIVICGPARLQMLKSADSLTVALDFGTVSVHVEDNSRIAIFTPLVTATPISVGGGERDVTVGLEQNGKMCLRASSGAVRIAQQLTGESVLVPQFGGLALSGGQLTPVAADAPGCGCELDAAKFAPAQPTGARSAPSSSTHQSVAAPTDGVVQDVIPDIRPDLIKPPVVISRDGAAADPVQAPALDEPTYKILMPALIFDAKNPAPPPDYGAETMTLVRSVRGREEIVFSGTIEPAKHAPVAQAQVNAAAQKPSSGVFARIGQFFKRMFGG